MLAINTINLWDCIEMRKDVLEIQGRVDSKFKNTVSTQDGKPNIIGVSLNQTMGYLWAKLSRVGPCRLRG